MFGKIINGQLNLHTTINPIITESGGNLFSENPEILAEYGYKEIIYTNPSPKDGYQALDFTWEEKENTIEQIWTYEPVPEMPYEPSYEERLDAIESAICELAELFVMLGGAE